MEPAAALPRPYRGVDDDHPEPVAATVSGTLPTWLRGTLLRVGPGLLSTDGWAAEHLFDGVALVQAWALSDDGVALRTRFARESRAFAEARAGTATLGGFGTPTRRSLLARLLQPIGQPGDNPAVNVVPWPGGPRVLSEVPTRWRLDPATLAMTAEPAHPAGRFRLAHPLPDPSGGGGVLDLALRYSLRSRVQVICEDPVSGAVDDVGPPLILDRVPYHHSFAATPGHVVLFHHPWALEPRRLLASNRSFADGHVWRDEPLVLTVLDRRAGAWRRWQAPTGFVFHAVNAYEDGEDVVVDACVYPDADVVRRLSVAALVAGEEPGGARLLRYRLRPGHDTAQVGPLPGLSPDDVPGMEFPAVRRFGRPHGVIWGVAHGDVDQGGGDHPGAPFSGLARVVPGQGASVRTFAGHALSEPVLVPRPGGDTEDDGVLLVVASPVDRDASTLLVLDAATLDTVARADLDRPLPPSFHGSFLPAGAAAAS